MVLPPLLWPLAPVLHPLHKGPGDIVPSPRPQPCFAPLALRARGWAHSDLGILVTLLTTFELVTKLKNKYERDGAMTLYRG